ncbi:MAG: CsbD family protein [Nocardiaceae bacterium]|nr:CsbD family protein [Nocardiaceae bacterium]
MGFRDRMSHRAQDLVGRSKEAAGVVSGNRRLRARGLMTQAKAKTRSSISKVRDGLWKLEKELRRGR